MVFLVPKVCQRSCYILGSNDGIDHGCESSLNSQVVIVDLGVVRGIKISKQSLTSFEGYYLFIPITNMSSFSSSFIEALASLMMSSGTYTIYSSASLHLILGQTQFQKKCAYVNHKFPNPILFFLLYLPKNMLINFKERRREEERKGEKHRSVASCTCPNQGLQKPSTQACAMNQNQTRNFCLRDDTQPAKLNGPFILQQGESFQNVYVTYFQIMKSHQSHQDSLSQN